MIIYLLCLFNIIIEFSYVLGQIQNVDECQIYNSLKGLPLNTNCCNEKCNPLSNKNTEFKDETVCNNDGFVKCLNLYNYSLQQLPSEVSNLIHLDHLNLRSNKIQQLPDFVANLKELKTLEIDNNNFTELPLVVTKLPKLEQLNLSHNLITDLPPSIGDITSLAYLGIHYNQLTTLPKQIGNLKNVYKINAIGNVISSLPDDFGNLEGLKTIYFSNNSIISLPSTFGKLKNLEIMDLSTNKITVLPDNIGDLKSLKSILLSNNNLKTLPSSIGNLTKLKKLDLSNDEPLDSLPQDLFKLNLEEINLDGCTNLNVQFLKFPSPLQKCSLTNTNISCYQQGACKNIYLSNSLIKENDFMKNKNVCPDGVTNTLNLEVSSNTLIYICIFVGISIIILAIIGFIYNNNRKKAKKDKKKNPSDVIIYEKHSAIPISDTVPIVNHVQIFSVPNPNSGVTSVDTVPLTSTESDITDKSDKPDKSNTSVSQIYNALPEPEAYDKLQLYSAPLHNSGTNEYHHDNPPPPYSVINEHQNI